VKILTAILTCSATQDRADACLDTWLKNIHDSNYYFYGDSLQSWEMDRTWDCSPDEGEHRHRLPEKTCKMLEKSLAYDWDFLFKCDDDTYVVFDRVLSLIEKFKHHKNLYLGKEMIHNNIHFAQGGAGYVLSRSSAEICLHRLKNFCKNYEITEKAEDYSVGLSMKEAGIDFIHCNEFHTPLLKKAKQDQNLCINAIKRGKATTHYVESITMKKIHDIFR